MNNLTTFLLTEKIKTVEEIANIKTLEENLNAKKRELVQVNEAATNLKIQTKPTPKREVESENINSKVGNSKLVKKGIPNSKSSQVDQETSSFRIRTKRRRGR